MNERQPNKLNKHCVDAGLLASLRDNELTTDERTQVEGHLEQCRDCAADERVLAASSHEVYDLLATLAPHADNGPDTATTLAAIHNRLANGDYKVSPLEPLHTAAWSAGGTQRVPVQGKTRRRYGWMIAAVAAVLVGLLVLPNASVLADQFLALFRVQQFQPVSVNPQSFRHDVISYLQGFGDTKVDYRDGNEPQNPSETQVRQYLHFPLLLPTHLPAGVGQTPNFELINKAAGTFTFDAAKARAYLAQTGQSSAQIPAQLDGATFTITSDTGVIINYAGTCQLKKGQSARSVINSSSPVSSAVSCTGGAPFFIAEIPSPVVQATGKASLKDLRDFVLSLPKLPSQEREMMQQLDLNNGVVPLPIPPGVNAQKVTARGASGVALVDKTLQLGGLIWQDHGKIYMIGTTTTSSDELVKTADSLR